MKVGFLAHANRYADALAQGQVLAPAKSAAAMARVVFNDRLDAGLCVLFMAGVLSVLVYSVRACLRARGHAQDQTREVPYQPLPAEARA